MSTVNLAPEDAMDVEKEQPSSKSSLLSTMQQLAVDRAFEQLFGYTWGTEFDLKEPQTRQENLLCRVLGKRAAATVLHSKNKRVIRVTAVKQVKHSSPTAKRPSTQLSNKSSVILTASPLAKVIEPAKTTFTAQPLAVQVQGGPQGGVDQVLKALQEGQGTSTIAKTSADWEVFKDQTGLGGKLEEKAEGKDAFLNRQAFLTRVDHRTFELERSDRDKERTKRGK
jgi:hypothetical protein